MLKIYNYAITLYQITAVFSPDSTNTKYSILIAWHIIYILSYFQYLQLTQTVQIIYQTLFSEISQEKMLKKKVKIHQDSFNNHLSKSQLPSIDQTNIKNQIKYNTYKEQKWSEITKIPQNKLDEYKNIPNKMLVEPQQNVEIRKRQNESPTHPPHPLTQQIEMEQRKEYNNKRLMELYIQFDKLYLGCRQLKITLLLSLPFILLQQRLSMDRFKSNILTIFTLRSGYTMTHLKRHLLKLYVKSCLSKLQNYKGSNQTYKVTIYNLKMQIQNVLIRSQMSRLSKQNAFLKIKIKMLQDRKRPSQITIINKQLYLDYMEQVLSYKQRQLIQVQKRLQQKDMNLMQVQSQNKLLYPLQNSTEIDIFLKKVQQIKKLVLSQSDNDLSFQVQEWKQFISKQNQIVEQCRNYQRQTQNLIKNQYQNLIRQRKSLADSMDRFEQLSSYQKYLNQLQKILQAKQKQVLMQQDRLHRNREIDQYQAAQLPSLTFGRQNGSLRQISDRKKPRIFQGTSKFQSSKIANQYQNDTSGYLKKPQHLNEDSSFIMQQGQNNDSQTIKKQANHKYKTQETNSTQSFGVQTNIEVIGESIQRLQKQTKICKFLNLWFKHSINTKKNSTVLSKKTIALYLWRLNSVYDGQLPQHLKDNFQWPTKYQESLKNQQLFPYSQLSLNRKKHAELTLDLDRKTLHRRKIQCSLKNIIRSKTIKQRVVVMCYIKKYVQKAKLKSMDEFYRASSGLNKTSGKDTKTTGVQPNSRINTQSQLISVNSSRIMNQNKIFTQNNRQCSRQGHRWSKGCLNPKSMSSKQLLTMSQRRFSKSIKQNISPGDSLDVKKLKQYIKNQQQAQRALAIQCVKSQAICKLGQTLIACSSGSVINGFLMIKQNHQNQRTAQLEKRISNYQFKWQLFMTKCKLALVNNNNKISHLEETLALMIGK